MALHSFFWVFKAIERPIGETESQQRVVTTQRCPHQTWPFFGGVVCVTRACVTTDAEVDDDASARLHSIGGKPGLRIFVAHDVLFVEIMTAMMSP
jgi:hypothetical protein|mmetsp:Transcript_1850/g.6378  ORF Transcript_1850/g.6378 Transcript_1850/m.6378 type:complete len:95 (+) Transcript_1850:243-527(+)